MKTTTPILYTSTIHSRNHFGHMLNGMGLTGYAVEVGTHRGEFAAEFLKFWKGVKLYCVDPWSNPPGFERQAEFLVGGGQDRVADFEMAIKAVKRYKGRVHFMQATSEQAVEQFKGVLLDFVYIDGDHEPPHPRGDIEMWWPKVKPGGILAGHDFMYPGAYGRVDDWGRFIQPAVLWFADQHGLDVGLVVEPNNMPWSWYIVKPKLEG